VHPGCGEALYLPDVFPGVPQIHYCEFYFHAFGGAIHFDPTEKPRIDTMARTRMRNTVNLLSLESMDWGIAPMGWQHSQYPPEFKDRISIIHDGVDTDLCRPNPAVRLKLREGMVVDRSQEIVTYIARNLEPVRGWPSFARAAAEICRRRPNCQILVVGGDGVSYSGTLPKGETYRQKLLDEVPLDPTRVHFLGRVPYPVFLRLLQVSRAHIYLTMPFVLSWSMLEAMSSECLLIGSRTAPIMEVIEDGVNGLLVDFFDVPGIVERVCEALEAGDSMQALRTRARETVLDRYALSKCLPAQAGLIEDVAAGRRGKLSPWPVVLPPELPPLPEEPPVPGPPRAADRPANPAPQAAG
jgi:glycosyltransferase involved in cell wall biosynthesis